MRRLGTIGVLVLAILVVTAQPASAAIITTDSFEDGDINEYTQTRPQNVTVQSGHPLAGQYALNVSATDGAGAAAAISTSGLETYPERGDTWTVFAQLDGDATARHDYFWAAQNDTLVPWGYRLRIVTLDGINAVQLELAKINGSGGASLDSTTMTHAESETLNITVRWAADGAMRVSLANRTSPDQKVWLNGTDGEFVTGGIGFAAEDDGTFGPGATGTATWDGPVVGDLYIYDINSPNSLIQPAKDNVTFYQGTTIIERETTTGIVSMQGLAPGTPVITTIESDAFYSRTTVLEDVRGNRSVYLLDDAETSIQPTFRLRDFVGLYPPDETYLLVQQNIQENWTTVAGDYFGTPNQVTPRLEPDGRYRLVIVNPTGGERRILGPITPTASGEIDLVVRQGNISVVGLGPSITNHPTTRVLPATDDPAHFETHLDRRDKPLDSWTITVTYTDPQGSETQLDQVSGTNPDGTTFEPDVNLSGREGGTVSVNVSYVLEGDRVNDTTDFVVLSEYNNSYALLPLLATIDSRLPAQHVGVFKGFVAVLVTVFGTGAVGTSLNASTEALGGVAVGFLAAFAILAWIPYTIVFVAGVAWLAFAGIRRGIG